MIGLYGVYRVIDKIIALRVHIMKVRTNRFFGWRQYERVWVYPSAVQWIIIKFLTCKGVKPSEILRGLQAQFPGNCPNIWVARTVFSRTWSGWKRTSRFASSNQFDKTKHCCGMRYYLAWSPFDDRENCIRGRNKLRKCRKFSPSYSHLWCITWAHHCTVESNEGI